METGTNQGASVLEVEGEVPCEDGVCASPGRGDGMRGCSEGW